MSKVDIKIVLLGMHNVGKTCLVERYLHDKFKENVTAVKKKTHKKILSIQIEQHFKENIHHFISFL